MNIIEETDSYKLTHAPMYPEGTTGVFSYLEAREGAKFDRTVFFGLQHILNEIAGVVVTQEDIDATAELIQGHLGPDVPTNLDGWQFIVDQCMGMLPIRIKAVEEGSALPNGHALMTVENTRPEAYWLTNALESLLLHVWYPTTVASLSRSVKVMLAAALDKSADDRSALPFMLHDFGYRGAATRESAAIGGAGHLVNFLGTDTVPALRLLKDEYEGSFGSLGFSVPATEHSIMTALGKEGEMDQVVRMLKMYPKGILSVVADSYSIYNFVEQVSTRFKDAICARDGKFVVRPDSNTLRHPMPASQMEYLLHALYEGFGGTVNSKGYKVLDPHVGLLWGDGIDPDGIEKIVVQAMAAGFSAANLVFGMGGGLLQKVNRDTQRFAFKSSAQQRNGEWVPISKAPLDATKQSKPGRLRLIKGGHGLATVAEGAHVPFDAVDLLQTVFEDGVIKRHYTIDEVRANAELA